MKKQKKTIRQGDKTALVRKLPRSMPASEVVERAAAKGMVISKAYVHNIRSASNKLSRKVLKEGGKKLPTGRQAEKLFAGLVVQMGPARARKLLNMAEAAIVAGKAAK
jgi:hypothetical protein